MVWLSLLVGCVPVLESPVDPTGDEEWRWEAPDNGWPASEPPEGLEGEGFGPGQVLDDFRLRDQHGDEVALWQFYGSVVIVDISTMWCAPCRALARGTEETYQHFLDQDVTYLTVLPEDVEGADPEQDDLVLWADSYGITAPVLSDPGHDWSGPAVTDGQYPAVYVIDRQMRVAREVNPVSDENIRLAVEELL